MDKYEKYVKTYFDGIIDKVHTKYDTLNVEYSSNVTENAIEAGENFTVNATVSAADGKSLPTAVVFNDTDAFPENEDGTLKANKFGEFSFFQFIPTDGFSTDIVGVLGTKTD